MHCSSGICKQARMENQEKEIRGSKKTGILRSKEIQISDKFYVCIHFNK
jgi:hypothetical protein